MDALARGVDRILAGFADEWSADKLAQYRAQLTERVQPELAGWSGPDKHVPLQELSEAVTELAMAKLQLERALDTIARVLEMDQQQVRVWAGEYGMLPVVDENGQIAYDATLAALLASRELEKLSRTQTLNAEC